MSRKKRISLTLAGEIIDDIDQEVDEINSRMGFNMTNRSNEIEKRLKRRRQRDPFDLF